MTKNASTKNKTKTPWPTKAAMEQVYSMKLWGDNQTEFYSGEGSHLPTLVEPYIQAVISFLSSFPTPLTICDLGCGDFNIGKQLLPFSKHYVAVDIVPDLIAYNKKIFKNDGLEFQCLDIAKDDLPEGDCAILRQVLQHLSNTEILQILNKLQQYKYIIITEHIPEGSFIANTDIISGQGIRIKKKSGVDILKAPFHFKATKVETLLSVTLPNNKGVVETKCYTI